MIVEYSTDRGEQPRWWRKNSTAFFAKCGYAQFLAECLGHVDLADGAKAAILQSWLRFGDRRQEVLVYVTLKIGRHPLFD